VVFREKETSVSDETYDYGEHTPKAGDNLLASISALAAEQKAAEATVARLEEELKEAQRALQDIAERRLPELMDAAESALYTSKDGIRVEIKENIRGSIKKGNEAEAFAWLEEHGHGDLIKREFKILFSKDEEVWAKKFEADLRKRKKALNLELKRSVAPPTLGAFVREELEKGTDVPLTTLGVYRQRVAKVTVSDKGKKDGPAPF
jgi:hypothetical protein